MDACEYYAQRLDSRYQDPRTEVKPVINSEVVTFALEFINDLCDPESYGHALPREVVARAGRIRAMMRPKSESPRTGIGYMEPPPARCERCDSE